MHVKIDHLSFLADFYVIDLPNDKHAMHSLLGRPFLKTAKTEFNIVDDSFTMKSSEGRIKHTIEESELIEVPPDDFYKFSIILLMDW